MKALLSAFQTAIPQAKLLGDAEISGVTTDSRRIQQGELFVALRGEHFDAHDFLEQVSKEGKAAAVIAEHVPPAFTLPALLVPDTKLALGDIARQWRQQFSMPIIGVTGSNGKTTVKEMIASIFSCHAKSDAWLATSGNLNNEIGVPLTVLRLNAQHQCAVVEMGMNHPGEIAYLASVAMPTIGLVNNAQREHQEFMHTVDAVAAENGAVLSSLPHDGTAVFPADDPYTSMWRGLAGQVKTRKILTFGLTDTADVCGEMLDASSQNHILGATTNTAGGMRIAIGEEKFLVQLTVFGRHNALNALAAAACCHAVGITSAVIKQGLERFHPVAGRLQRKATPRGAIVIDDTYNANPDSVRAAIDVLAQFSGKRVMVLGDMGEVGDQGEMFHDEVGALAKQRGIEAFFTFGSLAQTASAAFGASGKHFGEIEALFEALDTYLMAHPSTTTVLIKGSRFMKMERVVAHLTQQENKGTH